MALKTLVRAVAAYGGADLLFRLAQLVVIPIYAHLLSVAEFGILALLTVSGALLGMLLNLGVNNAVARFYFDAETRPEQRPILVSTGLAQLVVSGIVTIGLMFLLLYGLREQIAADYGLRWALVLIVLLTVLPDQIAQYALDAVRLQFAPLKFFVIGLVKNLLGILLGVWFVLRWDMGVAGLLLGLLIAAIAAAPLGLVMIRRDLVLRFDSRMVRKVFHFGYPFVLAGAAYWVFGSMDRWLLVELSDIEQVGLFSIGFKFAAVISFVISAFGQAWSPFAYKMSAEGAQYRNFFAKIFSGWFFILALAGLALALFSREIMMLLTPPRYWGASQIVGIGAAGLVLYGTTLITAMGISLEKRTMLLTSAAWMAALANVLINLLLIPRYGAVGAAVSTFLAYALLTAALLYWSQKLHPLPLEHGKLAYSCLLIAAALAASFVQTEPSFVSFAAKGAVLLAALGGAFLAKLLSRDLYRQLRVQLAP